MRKLRIGVVDLVSRGPTKALYARVMNANLASIMPQVVAAWCEAEGHDVTHVCYTGFEDLVAELPARVDLVHQLQALGLEHRSGDGHFRVQ